MLELMRPPTLLTLHLVLPLVSIISVLLQIRHLGLELFGVLP